MQHLFHFRWPQGFRCPRCQQERAYFHRTRHLYECPACASQVSLTAGTIFPEDQNSFEKVVLDDLSQGPPETPRLPVVAPTSFEDRTYKTVWTMGQKIRQAMADRDAAYQLAGLLEMDDAYLGATKPGKRGRGASGKAKVLVAVETPGDKPRFAALRQVPQAGRHDLKGGAQECLLAAATVRTDGWQPYRVLAEVPHRHEP